MKPMTSIKRRSRTASSTALALGSCLLLAFTGCTEGEGRDAPADADETGAEMRADEARTDDPSSAEGTPTERPRDTTAAAGTEERARDTATATAADESARDTASTEEARATIPSGTSMVFTVNETVSTDDNEVGDQFTADLRSDVTGQDGTTLIESGTPSRWTVAEASTEDGQTVLAAQLESVQLEGEWRSVPATVVSADVETDTAATGGETAAKVGVGAAAGALIGQILGEDTRSTLAGAGVGAAVGTAVALATRGGSATLPEGSTLTIELTESLTVTP